MPDESNFIVEILLKAIDQASPAIRSLNRSVDDLKAKSAGNQATGDLSSGLDDVGRAARDAEGDVRRHREETERAAQSTRTHADSVGRSADAVSSQGSALDRARESVKAHSTQTDDSTKKIKDHTEAVNRLVAEYNGWKIASRDVGLSNTESARGLSQISQEADKLTKVLPRASQAWRDMANVAQEAKRASTSAGTSDDIARLTKSYRDFDALAKSGQVTASAAKDSYRDFATSFDHLRDSIDKGSDSWRQIGRAIDDATKKAEHAKSVVTGGGLVSGFLGQLKSGVSGGGLNDIDRAFQNLSAHVDQVGIKVVSLSAQLRGALLAAGIGLFQQLDTAIVGVIGSLFSVGSAAVQAGAALGGALVAGAGQAIPTLGLLAGALERLKLIMSAVQAASNLQQQSAIGGAQAHIQSLSATNSVISAQQQLANSSIAVHNAQVNVTQSQIALTTARRDAQRQITDLMLAEKAAQLQEEGANITLTQAQQNLQQVILSGGTGTALSSAQLGVQQARLGVQQANVALPRARQDAARAQRQGVSGNPSVVAATQAVQQGSQALAQAQQQVGAAARALQIAELQAKNSTGAIQTATKTLDALLAKLSPAERQVYDVMERLRKYFQDPSSPFNKIADYIVAPFAGGLNRLLDLLNDRKFLAPLDSLGKALGAGVQKIFGALLGKQGAGFLEDMATQAAKNIPTIVGSITQLMKIFEDIAKAGGPALRTFLVDFNHFVTALATKWSTPQGLDKLTDFFNTGAKYAADFFHWAGALFNLLGALGSQAAPVGDNIVQGWTKSLNDMAGWVRTHGEEVHQFFVQAGDALHSVMEIVAAVALGMIKVMSSGGLAALATLFSQVIVPVLVDAGRVLGIFTHGILDLLNAIPGLRTFFDAFGGAAIAAVLIGKLYSPLRRLGGALNDLRKGNFSKLFGGGGDIKFDSTGMETAATTMDTAADKMGAAADKMSTAATGQDAAATEQGVASEEQVSAATAQGLASDKEVAAAAVQQTAATEEVAAGAERGVGGVPGATGGLGALGTLGLVGGGAALFAQLMTSLFHAGPQQLNIPQFVQHGGHLSGFQESAFGGSLDPKISRKAASDLLSGTKGLDVTQETDQQLKTLRAEAEKIARLPDITATQRKGLRQLADELDPANVAMKKAGELWGQTFAGINTTTGNVMQQVKQTLQEDIKNISTNLGLGTQKGAEALSATIAGAWNTVMKNTSLGSEGIYKGISSINKMLNEALGKLGEKPISLSGQISSVASAGAGIVQRTLTGLGNAIGGFATGGYEQPKSGGKIIQVAEGGYPEVVLTTDPKHADRQRGLLSRYLQEAPHVLDGSYASGGVAGGGNVWEVRASQEEASSGAGWTELSPNGNAAARLGIPHSFSNDPGHYPDFASLGKFFPNGTLALKIRGPRGSGTWNKTDSGDGSSFAPAIGLTPAVSGVTGGTGGTVQITRADGGDLHPFPGMARLISGSGGFAAAGAAASSAAAAISAPAIKGAGAIGDLARGAIKKVTDATNKYLQGVTATVASPASVAAGGGGSLPVKSYKGEPSGYGPIPAPMSSDYRSPPSQGPSGVGNFGGYQVADWIIPMLQFGRQHGWGGNITSGYRPGNDPGTSTGGPGEHAGTQYPHGAVDFGGRGPVDSPSGQNRAAFFRAAAGFKGFQIIPEQFPPYGQYPQGDAGHASGTGHALGGWIAAARGFSGIVRRPTAFLTGERNRPEHVQVTPMAAGGYIPAGSGMSGTMGEVSSGINWGNIDSIGYVIKSIQQSLHKLDGISIKSSQFASNFTPFINNLLQQDTGVFDRLAAGFTVIQNALNAAMILGAKAVAIGVPQAQQGYLRGLQPAYNVAQNGTVSQALDPAAQDAQSVRALEEQRKYLTGERSGLEAALGPVARKMQQAQALAKKDPAKYTKALQSLTAQYNALIKRVQDITGQISQNVTDTFSAEQSRVQDLLTRVSNKFDTSQGRIQANQSIAQSTGNLTQSSRLDTQLAQSATAEIAALQPALKEAEKIKDPALIAQIRQQMQQLKVTAAQAAIQALTDAQGAVDQAAQERQSGIQSKQSIAQAYGNLSQLPGLDQQMAGAAQDQINQLTPILQKARSHGDTALADSIQQEINQLKGTVAQSLTQIISDEVNEIQTQFQSQQAQIQSSQSIAQTLGQYNLLPQIDAQLMSSYQGQISQLQGVLAQAQAQGNQGAVASITQQIAQLQSSVVQMAAQMISDQMQAIAQVAQTQQARVSLMQTLSQVAVSQGNFGQGAGLELSSLQLNQSSMQSQLSQYNTLLGQASAQGNQGAVAQLTQQIDQLTGELAQNTQAITDNTATFVGQSAQAIQARGSFSTGIFGGLAQVVTTLGQISGGTDVKALQGLYQGSNTVLQGTQSGLLSQLSALGSGGAALAQMLSGASTPQEFVNALSGANFTTLEAGQSQAWISSFESIVSSMESNTQAVATNNQQLATLNGQLSAPQSWTTTAWSAFRSAIFSGMGNLLPQYQSVLPGGSQPMIAPVFGAASMPSMPTIGTLNINHVPGATVDPQTLGQQLAHHVTTAL